MFAKIESANKAIQDEKDSLLPSELRKKTVRRKNLLWSETCKRLPVDSREGATFTQVGDEAWLIGGVGETVRKEIYSFDLKTLTFQKRLSAPPVPRISRFNHGAYAYQKKIYLFGGEVFSSYHFSSKHCTNDMWVFNTEDLTWKQKKTDSLYMQPRRSHATSGINRYMLIYGGYAVEDEILNELRVFNIQTSSWFEPSVDLSPLPYLAQHSMTAVFSSPSKVSDLFNCKYIAPRVSGC